MAVERRALPTDAASRHVGFQPLAQRARRLALAADPHRKMAAAREDPDVAFQVRQKLYVDLLLVALHVIAQRGHGIRRRELRPHVAQRIARARWPRCRNPRPLCRPPSASRQPAPCRSMPHHAGLLDLRARPLGPLQQHAIQVEARVNHQRIAQLAASLSPAFGAASTLSVTIRFGVAFSIRNGYWL